MRAARVGSAWPIPALLLLAVLWSGAAEAFVPSLPSLGGIRRVPQKPGVSTLVGAIGRGRGTPNEDIWQLGEDQVEKNKAKTPRAPAAARKKNVVRPGEIAPGQAVDKDAALNRIKENTGGKGKDFVPFKNVGRLKPRKEMSEAELKLYEKRVELSRAMLNRGAPPTAESLVYVPAWNMEEAGEVRRVGEKPVEEEDESLKKFDDGPRKLKPPLEVLEMIKTLQGFLNQGAYVREELERNRDAQISIARVKLMRKHWLDWLEGGDEELAAIGRDPARHSKETRDEFVKEMEEARDYGLRMRIPDDDECIASLTGASGSKEAKDVRKMASIASKMANDLTQQYGEEDAQKITNALAEIKPLNPLQPGADPDLHSQILAALAVLEVYMTRAEDAEAADLRKTAAENVSVDWVKGQGVTETPRKKSQWEVKRPGDPGYGQAAQYGEDRDLGRGWDDENDDDGWGRQGRGRYGDDDQGGYGGYDDIGQGMSTDWEKPGRERSARPVPMQDGSLRDGDEVTAKVIARTPLGYALEVNGKYDGLTYHSDVFSEPPEIGWEGPAWVLKVRRDGKMDVSLRPPGAHRKIADGAQRILFALENAGGMIEVGDRSDPDTVYDAFGLSKKAFKDATGFMYRRKMISVGDDMIELNPEGEWADRAMDDINKGVSRGQGGGGGGGDRGRSRTTFQGGGGGQGAGIEVNWERPGAKAGPTRDAWPAKRGAGGAAGAGGASWGAYASNEEETTEESDDGDDDDDWGGIEFSKEDSSYSPTSKKRSGSVVAVLNEWDREDIEEELFEEGLVVKDEDFLQNDIQDPDKGLSFVEKRKSEANELSEDDDFPRSPSRSPSSTGSD